MSILPVFANQWHSRANNRMPPSVATNTSTSYLILTRLAHGDLNEDYHHSRDHPSNPGSYVSQFSHCSDHQAAATGSSCPKPSTAGGPDLPFNRANGQCFVTRFVLATARISLSRSSISLPVATCLQTPLARHDSPV
jgi:hypothetical protein